MRIRYKYVNTLNQDLRQRFRKEYLSQIMNKPGKKTATPLKSCREQDIGWYKHPTSTTVVPLELDTESETNLTSQKYLEDKSDSHGFHHRAKAKTSLEDDDVPIDDTTTKPLFTPQEKECKGTRDKVPRLRWNPWQKHVRSIYERKNTSRVAEWTRHLPGMTPNTLLLRSQTSVFDIDLKPTDYSVAAKALPEIWLVRRGEYRRVLNRANMGNRNIAEIQVVWQFSASCRLPDTSKLSHVADKIAAKIPFSTVTITATTSTVHRHLLTPRTQSNDNDHNSCPNDHKFNFNKSQLQPKRPQPQPQRPQLPL
ncbi:hypothetical protein LAZ67_5003399 [Cordylochernes scorpioides]|uniref:Uncharacterized protein n=1 Tax=Cordylochernes scorpioides TaxID=51811 RepID=A0ABY6KHY3_9ARAC|nr:hypothetical protein LAZ67_5003399 [Cordylochernes scorpioides]